MSSNHTSTHPRPTISNSNDSIVKFCFFILVAFIGSLCLIVYVIDIFLVYVLIQSLWAMTSIEDVIESTTSANLNPDDDEGPELELVPKEDQDDVQLGLNLPHGSGSTREDAGSFLAETEFNSEDCEDHHRASACLCSVGNEEPAANDLESHARYKPVVNFSRKLNMPNGPKVPRDLLSETEQILELPTGTFDGCCTEYPAIAVTPVTSAFQTGDAQCRGHNVISQAQSRPRCERDDRTDSVFKTKLHRFILKDLDEIPTCKSSIYENKPSMAPPFRLSRVVTMIKHKLASPWYRDENGEGLPKHKTRPSYQTGQYWSPCSIPDAGLQVDYRRTSGKPTIKSQREDFDNIVGRQSEPDSRSEHLNGHHGGHDKSKRVIKSGKICAVKAEHSERLTLENAPRALCCSNKVFDDSGAIGLRGGGNSKQWFSLFRRKRHEDSKNSTQEFTTGVPSCRKARQKAARQTDPVIPVSGQAASILPGIRRATIQRYRRPREVPNKVELPRLLWWLAGGRPLEPESRQLNIGDLRTWRRRSDSVEDGPLRSVRQGERSRRRGFWDELTYTLSDGRWKSGRHGEDRKSDEGNFWD